MGFHFQPYNYNSHVLLSSRLEELKRLGHSRMVEPYEHAGRHFGFVLKYAPEKEKRQCLKL